MSANWTDEKNHFPAASTAASSDWGRNHTLHEVPLCRWCFIQRVFKKNKKNTAEWGMFAPAQRQSLCEMGLFISEVCVSLSEIQRLASHIRGAFSLIFYLFVFFFPPLLLPSRRHRLVLFGFLVQKSRHLSRQSWTTKIRRTLWRQRRIVRDS